MNSLSNEIKRLKKKYNKYYFAKMKYVSFYEKCAIDSKAILLESQHGSQFSGNIFYMIKYLSASPQYKDFKIYLTSRESNDRQFQQQLRDNGIDNVTTVVLSSREYFKVLASAKYLINDNTFLPFFIKKEGQVYINTWHGTPLKTLGRKIKNDYHRIGNTQKNFIVADYLLFPNEFTRDRMTEDYMIENLTKAKVVLSGYPRNTAFFDNSVRSEIRERFNFDGKHVYMYMPTWRGAVNNIDNKSNIYLQYYLFEIEKELKDNEILYVNLHPIAKKNINFAMFSKIKPFPKGYETYEFLNAGDCLITDYSSVMFDYAVTGRKVINFTYDEEEYLADRGLYIGLDELPFPKVPDVNSLIKELRSPKSYDDKEFLRKFCSYDSADAVSALCDELVLNKSRGLKIENIEGNGKENVLIYVANLAKNGITTAAKNLLRNVDTSKRNYYITFNAKNTAPYKEQLLEFPENVKYISMLGIMNANFFEKCLIKSYADKEKNTKRYLKNMKKAYKRELKRLFGPAEFKTVIQFTGYEYKKVVLFSYFDCNKVIYVHSDMKKEISVRHNARSGILEYAYEHYDKVALVTDDLIDVTSEFTKNDSSNFVIANNIINHNEISKKSRLDVSLDKNTTINVTYDKLTEALDSDAKKFITIGRFSPEKGHERLLTAFNRVWLEDNNTFLIIIGGHGGNYKRLCKMAKELECADNVILIRSMTNPYTVLRRCDYFVLSSYYEGFGLVLAEADICGLPVISTDITGPRGFMQKHGGTLVENNEQGLYDGMKKLLSGEIAPMNVDYKEYNSNAINQFESLLNQV